MEAFLGEKIPVRIGEVITQPASRSFAGDEKGKEGRAWQGE